MGGSLSVWVRGSLVLATSALCLHCGSSSDSKGQSAGAGGASTGGNPGAAGADQTDYGGAVNAIPGAPGCGLGDKAAFCDSFDQPSANRGRAGELDTAKWSGAHVQPQFPTAGPASIGITAATIPSCRMGIPQHVFPEQDALICDPDAQLASNHLLVAVAAQNYGQNSYRIRQPFDFEGRAGKVVFDVDGTNVPLFGWVSLDITEDPIPGPGFDTGVGNDEGNQLPRNALEIQLQNKCDGIANVPSVGVRFVAVWNDYKGTFATPSDYVCVTTAPGHVNHFEVTVSKSKVEVTGTDFSVDGHTFSEPKLMYSTPVSLPFTRGYVNITTHNHATLKYSPNHDLDSWVAVWDNVGFDGPVISNTREYEIPDSLVTGMNASMQPITNIGYRVPDVAAGPSAALHFSGVDLSGVKTARLALSAYYLFTDAAGGGHDLEATKKYLLKYRFNGGTWRDRPLSLTEATILNGLSQGQLAEMIELDPTDLVAGDNSLEFVTANVPQNYPPVVSNIDLILSH